MKVDTRKQPPKWIGATSSAMGIYMCAQAAGIAPINHAALHVPPWLFFVVGVMFATFGMMILIGSHSKASDLLAFAFASSFGVVLFWIAFFSPPDSISGGIPFLTSPYSSFVNQGMVGLIAAVCFTMSAYALHRHIKRHA